MSRFRSLFCFLCINLALWLAACAALPDSVAAIDWRDLQGDRGAGVLARDWHMCAELVENRRSAMAGCLERLGWVMPE